MIKINTQDDDGKIEIIYSRKTESTKIAERNVVAIRIYEKIIEFECENGEKIGCKKMEFENIDLKESEEKDGF